MRRLALLTLLVVMVAVATAPAQAEKSGSEVPFKASLGGDVVVLDPFADFAARCSEIDPGEVDFVTTFAGSGQATHLGRVEVWAQHCTDIDTGRYGDGVLRITAANRDVLMGTYGAGLTMPADPTDPMPTLFVFTDDFAFGDGGTGRFSFASGGGVESGDFDVLGNTWTMVMEGTVSYRR